MKVKDLVSKVRIADTHIELVENGKVFAITDMKTLMKYYQDAKQKMELPVMDRTVNTFEIKNNALVIWVKPLE